MSDDLRICIPIEPPEHGGGGFRFIRNFEAYLDRHGIGRTRDVRGGARVLFANSWQVPWTDIVRAAWHRPDVTVVHRIDGAAQDYGRDPSADRAQSRVDRLADLTIFQSAYCRFSTREKFPVIRHDGPVIHNPVDLAIFSPDGPRLELPAWDGPRVAAVSWSTNPRKGASSVYRVAARRPDAQFVLIGRFDAAPATPNVLQAGVLAADGVAAALRACDVLLTFSENEACPNHVLEALACGLPVLYLDSGATRELVGDAGHPVTEDDAAERLTATVAERAVIGARARARAVERFDPERAFAAYIAAIRAALRPPSRRLARVAALVRAAA